MQMCGRVFRKYPNIPYKQIVQSDRTRWSFHRTATPQRKFVYDNGTWLGVMSSAALEIATMNVVIGMAGTDIHLPKCMLKYQKLLASARGRRTMRDGPPTEATPAGNGADD